MIRRLEVRTPSKAKLFILIFSQNCATITEPFGITMFATLLLLFVDYSPPPPHFIYNDDSRLSKKEIERDREREGEIEKDRERERETKR